MANVTFQSNFRNVSQQELWQKQRSEEAVLGGRRHCSQTRKGLGPVNLERRSTKVDSPAVDSRSTNGNVKIEEAENGDDNVQASTCQPYPFIDACPSDYQPETNDGSGSKDRELELRQGFAKDGNLLFYQHGTQIIDGRLEDNSERSPPRNVFDELFDQKDEFVVQEQCSGPQRRMCEVKDRSQYGEGGFSSSGLNGTNDGNATHCNRQLNRTGMASVTVAQGDHKSDNKIPYVNISSDLQLPTKRPSELDQDSRRSIKAEIDGEESQST